MMALPLLLLGTTAALLILTLYDPRRPVAWVDLPFGLALSAENLRFIVWRDGISIARLSLWALTAVAGGLAYGCSRIRLRPGQVAGKCRACSYDLTANVSGVCPECGMPVVPAERTTP